MRDAVYDVLLDIRDVDARVLRILGEHLVNEALHVDRFGAELVEDLQPT